MRILHCVASLAPRHGGPTVAVLGMVRAQRELGIDAVILSSDDDVGGRLDVRIQVRSFNAVCRMVAAGVGIGMVPRSAARVGVRLRKARKRAEADRPRTAPSDPC